MREGSADIRRKLSSGVKKAGIRGEKPIFAQAHALSPTVSVFFRSYFSWDSRPKL
jgi:hypothetical protein